MLRQLDVLKVVEKITPNKLFAAPYVEKQLYLQDWINNGYWLGGQISPHTALMTTVHSFKQFEEEEIMRKITLPTLMIKSARDKTVCPDAIDKEF